MSRLGPPPAGSPRAAPEGKSIALAIACGLSLSVLFHCSVPAKQAQDDPASSSPIGSGQDAGRDASSQEVGLEPGADADTRNALCGGNTCNPDEGAVTCSPTGAAGASGGTGAVTQTCRVGRSATGTGGPVAACGPVGTVIEQGACQSQAECGAGLVCVGALGDTAGICRPYCCYGQDRCREYTGTYCTLVRAFEIGAGLDALSVPACMVADNCRLLEPGACEGDLACTFLDGATTCLVPGKGKDGEPCGCAAGYVCLQSTNTCRRICHERADAECGGGGTCVSGGATFPEGFGVCSK